MKKYLETNAAWDDQKWSDYVEVYSTPRVMSVLYWDAQNYLNGDVQISHFK